ncbi:MAG: efflux RND transporter periplasmic adaptor subunit [Cellvibrionaceae bacterium]
MIKKVLSENIHPFKALGFGLLLLSLSALSNHSQSESLPTVAVETVIASPVTPILTLTGNVHSRASLPITAGLDAQLNWVAEPGTRVSSGDAVVRFDAEPLSLLQAEQKALIARDRVQLSYLNRELKRMQKLHQRKNVSEDELEEVQSRRDIAQQDIAVAKTRLAIIEERLSRTQVNAPFEGVVVKRDHREGEDVSRGDVILQLQQVDPLEVRLFVPVKHLASLSAGQPITVFRQTLNRENSSAIIRSIVPSADVRSQTVEVRIDLSQNNDRPWIPGELLNAELELKPERGQIAVPRDAILIRSDGTYVVAIDKDRVAHRIKVQLGKAQGQWINIRTQDQTLNAGEQVAIRGAERLRQGQSVNIHNG